mmetsp:Transcript_33416/g.78509  ORF Transcript_33416/g.78509 Transcript_33416/m.78509 type:complete len:214 (+) Transcript_33416:726-1367(+)
MVAQPQAHREREVVGGGKPHHAGTRVSNLHDNRSGAHERPEGARCAVPCDHEVCVCEERDGGGQRVLAPDERLHARKGEGGAESALQLGVVPQLPHARLRAVHQQYAQPCRLGRPGKGGDERALHEPTRLDPLVVARSLVEQVIPAGGRVGHVCVLGRHARLDEDALGRKVEPLRVVSVHTLPPHHAPAEIARSGRARQRREHLCERLQHAGG